MAQHPNSLDNLKKPWQPGESGNPDGRPPDSPELKALKHLTKEELTDVASLIVKGKIEDLEELKTTGTILQRMVASVAIRIMNKGDMFHLDVLLNRLIGKVKDEVQIDDVRSRITINIPDNGRDK